MRAAGLQGVRRGRKPITTRPAREPDARPDLVERQFRADHPHQLWVADITYVRILGGFCYVAFITDVFTRRIVGWAVSASLHTQGLPLLALEHALLSTGASRGRQGLIHHSDRRAQFRSTLFQDALTAHGLVGSMGQVGAAGDNAAMESFFALLQKNVLDRRDWDTRDELRAGIITWIERTYHRRRRQVRLGRLTPVEYELIMDHTPADAA